MDNCHDHEASKVLGVKPILIVLIAGIGNMVFASKAIRSVRRGHPHSEINLITSPESPHLPKKNPCLDQVQPLPIRALRTDKGTSWIWRVSSDFFIVITIESEFPEQ